jgi:hypothetical protein
MTPGAVEFVEQMVGTNAEGYILLQVQPANRLRLVPQRRKRRRAHRHQRGRSPVHLDYGVKGRHALTLQVDNRIGIASYGHPPAVRQVLPMHQGQERQLAAQAFVPCLSKLFDVVGGCAFRHRARLRRNPKP